MVHSSFVTCTYLAVIYLVVPLACGYTLPASIQKCAKGDEVCVGNSLTRMIQHSDVYPELKIPKLEPFTPKESWVLRTSGSNLPIKFVINTSNMLISGFKQVIVHRFSGFRPNLKNTIISSNVSLPTIKLSTNFKATAQLAMLNIEPEGLLTMDLTNAEVPITYGGEFVRRDGKDYYVIKSVKGHLNISRLKINTKCKNLFGWINVQLNNVLNANWKLLKTELDNSLDKYIGAIIQSILQPILEQVAIQDFYKN